MHLKNIQIKEKITFKYTWKILNEKKKSEPGKDKKEKCVFKCTWKIFLKNVNGKKQRKRSAPSNASSNACNVSKHRDVGKKAFLPTCE